MNVIIFVRDSECYKINALIVTYISKAKLQPQILKSLGKDKAVVCSKKSIIKWLKSYCRKNIMLKCHIFKNI